MLNYNYVIFIFLFILILILYIIAIYKDSYIISLTHGLYIFIITSIIQLNIFTSPVLLLTNETYNNETLQTDIIPTYDIIILPEYIIVIFLVFGIICIFRAISLAKDERYNKIEKDGN